MRGIALVATACVVVGCSDDTTNAVRRRELHTITGETMGTTYSVKVVADPVAFDRATLGSAIARRLDEIDARMSHYRSDSELERFNRARTTDPRPLSQETVDLVAEAMAVSRVSRGAFDVTVGPLVDLWGFGPDGPPATVPDDAALAALRVAVGYELLDIDRARSTLRKRHAGLRVDLSAIAKGYAVDAVTSLLADAGRHDHLVEIGGELRASGTAEHGGPWRVAIERPVPGSAPHRIIPLTNGAIATSGEYRNFYELDGVQVSHTIDPRTGRPVTHRLSSVSVLADRCAIADARATALEVLGPDDGYALAAAEGWAALFLLRDERDALIARSTPAFERRVDLDDSAP